jgi:hypothetical protein
MTMTPFVVPITQIPQFVFIDNALILAGSSSLSTAEITDIGYFEG